MGPVTYTADDHARMKFVRAMEDWLLFDIRQPRDPDRERQLLLRIEETLKALKDALPCERPIPRYDRARALLKRLDEP